MSGRSQSQVKLNISKTTVSCISSPQCQCSSSIVPIPSRTITSSSLQSYCSEAKIETVEPDSDCNCDCENVYQLSLPPVLKNIMQLLTFRKNRKPELCAVLDVIESLKDDLIKVNDYFKNRSRINMDKLLRGMMCKLSQLEYNAKNNDLLCNKGDLLKQKKQIINLTHNTKTLLCKQLCSEMKRLKTRHKELSKMLQNVRNIDCDLKQKNKRICQPKNPKSQKYDLTGMKITYTKTTINGTDTKGKFTSGLRSDDDFNVQLEKGGQLVDNCSEETKEKIKLMSNFWYEQAQQLINTLTP